VVQEQTLVSGELLVAGPNPELAAESTYIGRCGICGSMTRKLS